MAPTTPGFGEITREHYRKTKGSMIYAIVAGVLAGVVLSLIKPRIGMQGITIGLAVSAALALMSTIAYAIERIVSYYLLRQRSFPGTADRSILARATYLSRILLLLLCISTLVELFSPACGVVVALLPPLERLQHQGDEAAPAETSASQAFTPQPFPPVEAEAPTMVENEPPPRMIRYWPLVRRGYELAWNRGGEKKELGFVERNAGNEILFRNLFTRTAHRVRQGEIEACVPGTTINTALGDSEEHYLERLLWKVATVLSIPEGVCIGEMNASGQATVNLPSSPHVRQGSMLHVVRLYPSEEYLGVVTVSQALPNQSLVSVPKSLKLRAGDWVFPDMPDSYAAPSLTVHVEGSAQNAEHSPIAESVESYCARFDRTLRRRLVDIGVGLNETTPDKATYALRIVVKPKTGNDRQMELEADLQLLSGDALLALGFLEKEQTVTLALPPVRFPYYLVTSRLFSAERQMGGRVVGWLAEDFDKAETSEMSAATQWNEAVGPATTEVSFRNLLTSTPVPVADPAPIVPLSLKWLDEEMLKDELPFYDYVAWKIARMVCLPAAQTHRRKESDARLVSFFGRPPLPDVTLSTTTLLTSPTDATVTFVNAGPPANTENSGLLVRAEGDVRFGSDSLVLLGPVPVRPPRLIFLNSTADARAVKPIFAGIGTRIGTDDHTDLALQRWGKTFNDHVLQSLADLKIDVVSEHQLRLLGDYALIGSPEKMNDATIGALAKWATHVVHTHVRFSERSDRAEVTVTLSELAGNTSRELMHEVGSAYVEEIYPKHQQSYRPAPYVLADVEIRKAKLGAMPPFPAQFVTESSDETGIAWLIRDQSHAIIPTQPPSGRTWRSNPIVERIADRAAQAMFPKAGKVIQIDSDTALVNLGAAHGVGPMARLKVLRMTKRPQQELRGLDDVAIAETRVVQRNQTTSVIALPDGIELKLGDYVLPYRRRGDIVSPRTPERFQLAVYPLKPVYPTNVPPHVRQFCETMGDRIARDLVTELRLYNVSIVANEQVQHLTQREFARPGVDASLAIKTGHALSATHLITGVLEPVSSTYARIDLVLVDIEAGEMFSLGSERISSKY